MDIESTYRAHNYHPIPVVIAKAEGVHVWDSEGRKYIDLLSCYSALNQHHHPRRYEVSNVYLGNARRQPT